MNKRNMKISIILNVIIPLMIVFSCIMMFTGFKIFNGPEPVLESTGFSIFRFFTVDSNLFMAIVAGIFAYYEYKLLIGTIKKKPRFVNILKLMSTVGVALTFIVVFVYLGPIAKDGLLSLLRNSNLFLHLLIPVCSIITFIFFDEIKLKYKDTFYGLVPVFIYSLYYATNILVHMSDGKVSPVYDFYWFVQTGMWMFFVVIPVIFAISYLISFLLYKANKKLSK